MYDLDLQSAFIELSTFYAQGKKDNYSYSNMDYRRNEKNAKPILRRKTNQNSTGYQKTAEATPFALQIHL